VLDLFGGSGSTLIACQQLNRNAFLMELDPLYCDVIVRRFLKFSGQTAECRDRNGQPTDRGEAIAALVAE
jgi:DNA modification methylase